MNWILSKGIRFIGGKLDGYKTKIGGVGLILTGIIGIINMMWPDTVPALPPIELEQIIGYIGGGFVALGIGGKMEKNTTAVKELTDVKSTATQNISTD